MLMATANRTFGLLRVDRHLLETSHSNKHGGMYSNKAITPSIIEISTVIRYII